MGCAISINVQSQEDSGRTEDSAYPPPAYDAIYENDDAKELEGDEIAESNPESDGDSDVMDPEYKAAVDNFLDFFKQGLCPESTENYWSASIDFDAAWDKFSSSVLEYAEKYSLASEMASYVCRVLKDYRHNSLTELWLASHQGDDNGTAVCHHGVITDIFKWLTLFTQENEVMQTEVAECGFLGKLLDEVDFIAAEDQREVTLDLLSSVVYLLHNCAKHAGNWQYFVDDEHSQALETLKEMVVGEQSVDSVAVKAAVTMMLCYIHDETDFDVPVMTDGKVLNFIIDYLSNAVQAENLQHGGFSAWELCDSLRLLAVVDENKTKIMEGGGLQAVVKLLEVGNKKQQTVAALTLWQLAFMEESRQAILGYKDSDVVGLLETINAAEQEKHEADQKDDDEYEQSALEQAVQGAIWELEDVWLDEAGEDNTDPDAVPTEFQTERNERRCRKLQERQEAESSWNSHSESSPHIMISYSHKNKDLVREMAEHLKRENFNVWIDYDQAPNYKSTFRMMADAVQRAEIVIVCASQAYENSENCETEALYANKKKKDMVFVHVEEGYKPDNWLGAMECACCDFYIKLHKLEESKIMELVKRLEVMKGQ